MGLQMQHEYTKWFRRTSGEFKPVMERFKGQPITYVEIGCFAGACCDWVAREILTHPESRGIGIDPYPPDGRRTPEQIEAIKQHAAALVRPLTCAGRWLWVYQDSAAVLRNFGSFLGDRPIDALFIDGNHWGHAALTDFVLAWKYLRVGSVVIFDDFGIGKRKSHPHVPAAVEAVVGAFGSLVKVINPGPLQFAVEVVKKWND